MRKFVPTHIPTSVFFDTACLESESEAERKKGKYGSQTPRTPFGSPRTPREVIESEPEKDKSKIRDLRQKDLIVSELLTDMDMAQISKMKTEFDRRGGEVSLIEFVHIVKEALNSGSGSGEGSNESAASLATDISSVVGKLRSLFEEIDINGDAKMSWEEFTSYIVKNGGSKEVSQTSAQHYEETELQHDIMLDRVEKLKFFPQLDRLVVCDRNQAVKLYKPVTNRFTEDFSLVKELNGHTGAILNAEYIGSSHSLCTSSTDNTVMLWDAGSFFRHKATIQAGQPQLSLLWNPASDSLLSSSTTGAIKIWDPNTCEQKGELIGHTDMTMDLKLIPNTPLLASASLDTRIYLWDLTTGEVSMQIKGHTKGVFSLAYSTKYKLLFSGSFDRDVLVWNPVIEGVLFRLKGHHTSLVGVECLEDTPYLISGDHDGYFKLWDIRTCDCIQTFTANQPIPNMGAFAMIPRQKRVVAGAKKLYIFDYHKPGIPWLTDNRPVTGVLYNSKTLTIITASGRDIKIWDATTGVLVQTFHNITSDDITACCLDTRERKLILGTGEGHVNIYNFTNGMLLRELSAHRGEVTAVLPVAKNMYMSASSDSHIWIHDELSPQKKSTVVSSFQTPPTVVESATIGRDIICANYSPELNMVISATINRIIRVWDFDATSMETQFKHHTAEVTGVLFLDPWPVGCSCDTHGWIMFYALKPAPMKNHLIAKFQNVLPNGKPSGVHSMAWVREKVNLYFGDETGDIKYLAIQPLFDKLSLLPVAAMRARAQMQVPSQTPNAPALPRPRSSSASPPNTPPAAAAGKPHFAREESSTLHLKDNIGFLSTASISIPVPAPSTVTGFNLDQTADLLQVAKSWNAHNESVTFLQVVHDPLAILSASRDLRVRAWSTDGTYHGTLRQSPGGGRWSLPVDIEAREADDAEQVKLVLDDLRKAEDAHVVLPPAATTPPPLPGSRQTRRAGSESLTLPAIQQPNRMVGVK